MKNLEMVLHVGRLLGFGFIFLSIVIVWLLQRSRIRPSARTALLGRLTLSACFMVWAAFFLVDGMYWLILAAAGDFEALPKFLFEFVLVFLLLFASWNLVKLAMWNWQLQQRRQRTKQRMQNNTEIGLGDLLEARINGGTE